MHKHVHHAFARAARSPSSHLVSRGISGSASGGHPPTPLVGIDYFVFLARLTARIILPKLYLQLWFDFSALVRRGSERLMFFDHGLRCVLRALSLILAAVVVLA